MQLVADRFAVDDRGHAIDLATGSRVSLVIGAASESAEQTMWAERCAWFSSVVHPALAPLLDYGAIGRHQRFEAWRADPGWRGSPLAGEQAAARVERLFRAHGRSGVEGIGVSLGCCAGRAVVIPDAAAGHPVNEVPAVVRVEREALAIERQPDARLAPLVELLGTAFGGRAVALAVWSPDGGGSGAAVHALARVARLAGRVPVAASLFEPRVRALVRGRTLLVVAGADCHAGWRALVEATLDAPGAHMLLFAGSQPVRRVHTVSLQRASVEALMATVSPSAAAARYARHVSAAARRSHGLRDRFEQLLFGVAHPVAGPFPEAASGPGEGVHGRAAEQLAGDADETDGPEPPDRPPVARWPAPGELARLGRQLESARALAARGRHQSAERNARQVMHAFGRRGEWASAAESALLLAGSLARRGRIAEADKVLSNARPWVTQSRDLGVMQDVSAVQGVLWIEQGRLTDAESLLESALVSAVSAETGRAFDLTIAIARCLRLQGRWADAWHRLACVQADAERAPGNGVLLWTGRCRVWLGRQRAAEAVADAARARDAARVLGSPALLGAALYACALALLAAGDPVEADAAAVRAIASARTAHDPMLALRARLLRAEIGRRHGLRTVAVRLVRRLCGGRAALLPFTVRARVELLRELLAAPDAAAAAERHADTVGLPALRLFAPAPQRSGAATGPAVDDIVELLRCCQTADEDATVLAAVCARLRARLNASGVAFYGVEDERAILLAADGTRSEAASALRIAAVNQLVLPRNDGERIEGGVPVRYAGRTVGVLVAQWSAGATWTDSDATVLLTTGATAAGPALSGAMARRVSPQRSSASDILGISPQIARVRAAVERAASAPFPVVIEGESGVGKELVARSLHRLGPRRDRPFCALNCAALPDDLVESELFGHARGAFTGAVGERRGVFEDAHGGTLFLDEVGELSLRAQAKLLRAIQEGEIRRVGENVHRRVDVRLVTATNRDLAAESAAGRFRADLLYRLDVIRIALPPLRERIDDVPLLAEHFWRDATERIGSRATLSAATLAALARYTWPGNIRELQNVLAALAVRCPKRGVVSPSALPLQFGARELEASFRLDMARQTFDRAFIRAALVRAGGHRTRAAEELGLSRQGLAKLVGKLGIKEPEQAGGAGEAG